MITIEGKKYKVTEDMGFNHDKGCYAKAIETDQGEKIVVRYPGCKTWEIVNSLVARIGPAGKATGQD